MCITKHSSGIFQGITTLSAQFLRSPISHFQIIIVFYDGVGYPKQYLFRSALSCVCVPSAAIFARLFPWFLGFTKMTHFYQSTRQSMRQKYHPATLIQTFHAHKTIMMTDVRCSNQYVTETSSCPATSGENMQSSEPHISHYSRPGRWLHTRETTKIIVNKERLLIK